MHIIDNQMLNCHVEVEVRAIGLGNVSGGRKFSEFTGFPRDKLYADPDGTCCQALGYERGFAPDADVSPYIKLFPMLLGVDSEGTIPEVTFVVNKNSEWVTCFSKGLHQTQLIHECCIT